MGLVISSELLRQITDHAASSTDEVCGLLFGDASAITNVCVCKNVAPDPTYRFEIDPAALIAAHRAARAGAQRPVGHFHSHPSGPPVPSPRDAVDAVPDGSIWLLVAGAEVRVWRAVENGPVEGRFEPVNLRVLDRHQC